MHTLIFRATLLLLIFVLLPLCMCVFEPVTKPRCWQREGDQHLFNGFLPLYIGQLHTGETDMPTSVAAPDQGGTGCFHPVPLSSLAFH